MISSTSNRRRINISSTILQNSKVINRPTRASTKFSDSSKFHKNWEPNLSTCTMIRTSNWAFKKHKNPNSSITTTNWQEKKIKNQHLKLGISIIIRNRNWEEKRIPGGWNIGGRGEEWDGSPFVLRSNLVFSQLFNQIRSSNHGCAPRPSFLWLKGGGGRAMVVENGGFNAATDESNEDLRNGIERKHWALSVVCSIRKSFFVLPPSAPSFSILLLLLLLPQIFTLGIPLFHFFESKI